MKLINSTDGNISLQMSHEQALMIVALIREATFGTPFHDFETRVGHSPNDVGKIATELNEILSGLGITE